MVVVVPVAVAVVVVCSSEPCLWVKRAQSPHPSSSAQFQMDVRSNYFVYVPASMTRGCRRRRVLLLYLFERLVALFPTQHHNSNLKESGMKGVDLG